MIITLDTNVLYAGLYSKKGASNFILRLIIDEKIKLAITVNTYFEYYDVLTRESTKEDFNLTSKEIEDILDLLALLAQKHSVYFLLRPNLSDEADNMFMECAFTSNSEYLITSNIKDYNSSELKDFVFNLITPKEFVIRWRESHE